MNVKSRLVNNFEHYLNHQIPNRHLQIPMNYTETFDKYYIWNIQVLVNVLII